MANFVCVFHSTANSELNSIMLHNSSVVLDTQYYQFCVLYTEETGFTVKHTQTHYHPTGDHPVHALLEIGIFDFFRHSTKIQLL